jgi:mannose-6-phosphate isomerase
MSILFLNSIFVEKIWGGNNLKLKYDFDIPSNHTGEYWAISGYKGFSSIVKNGQYKGYSLEELWEGHRELFGKEQGNIFPLLTKIIDASDNLSVQVHPDNVYACNYENSIGKSECWYILDARPNAKIVYGHRAKTKVELKNMVENGKWNDLLIEVPVKRGDFFYIPSGVVHAIGAGIMVLETQQSSDVTYRLFDYDRVDDNGIKRELHIDRALDVINTPFIMPKVISTVKKDGKSSIVTLIKSEFFSVYKWIIKSEIKLKRTMSFILCSVISGEGKITIDDVVYLLKSGEQFIITYDITNWILDGEMEIIASTIGD